MAAPPWVSGSCWPGHCRFCCGLMADHSALSGCQTHRPGPPFGCCVRWSTCPFYCFSGSGLGQCASLVTSWICWSRRSQNRVDLRSPASRIFGIALRYQRAALGGVLSRAKRYFVVLANADHHVGDHHTPVSIETGGGVAMSFGLGMFCVTCALGLLLLLALEGLVCIVMAAPLVYGGGIIVRCSESPSRRRKSSRRRSILPAIVLMPVLALLERG